MIIAGLQKTTLIDYPGKIACVVFLAGCNFRCPWCYSSELVLPEKIVKQGRMPEKEFFDFLKERRGFIDGVVICGGEPTINKDLLKFVKKIKDLGYLVKLDTNGSNPKMLQELIGAKLIDYVAMDIKAPRAPNFQFPISNFQLNPNDQISKSKSAYEGVLFDGVKMEDIEKSVEILKQNKIDFEFRTTVVPGIHKKEDFLEIAKWIGGKDVKYYLQNFVAQKTIDPDFEKVKAYPIDWLEDMAKEIYFYFKICKVRS